MSHNNLSRKFLAALSGTYNVHANEIAHGSSVSNVQQQNDDVPTTISGAGATTASRTGTFGSNLLPTAIVKLVQRQQHHNHQQQQQYNTLTLQQQQYETIKCLVYFLDDTQHLFEVDVSLSH